MKRVVLLVIAALLLSGFTACGSSTPQKAPEPLTLGVLPDVDSVPLVIAREKGYFEKEGVQVNIESFKSAPDRESALQSGKLDGAVSDMLAAAFSREGGFEVIITSMTNGSYKLLVGKDSGIKSFPDVKGKSVAISQNTIIEYATDAMLEKNGMTPEDINKVVVPQIPVRLEMLQNGKIDGATLPEPMATAAIAGGAKLLDSTDKMGISPGVLLFTKKACEAKAKEIQAFYRAYNLAADYLGKEPVDSYLDGVIKELGFPDSVKGAIALPAYTRAVLPPEEDFNRVTGWLTGKELIKKSYKFGDVADGRFLKE